jgi:hypothetical protein
LRWANQNDSLPHYTQEKKEKKERELGMDPHSPSNSQKEQEASITTMTSYIAKTIKVCKQMKIVYFWVNLKP